MYTYLGVLTLQNTRNKNFALELVTMTKEKIFQFTY